MRRFACFLLAFFFAIGLLPGISLSAFAEDAVKLQEATLDFTLPSVGEALPAAFQTNPGFVVDAYSWEVYRDGSWQPLSQEEMVYSEDQTYKLRVQLICDTGYFVDFDAFPSGYMPAMINGESTQAAFFTDETDGTYRKGVVLETLIFGNAVPTVTQLDISGIPVETGTAFTAQKLVLSDARVSIVSCEIYMNGEKVDQCELGYGWYNIHINISVAEGYVLNLDQITVNGLSSAECGWDVSCGSEISEGWISLTCEREADSGYIDGVTVSGAPATISADATITVPELAVKWSNNGNVTVSNAQWVDQDYVAVSGNFVLGNIYYLQITLQTEGDMPFRDFFNLEVLDETEQYYTAAIATATNATTAVAYIRYALLPKVDFIHIQVPQPAVGEAPGVPMTDADALFTIDSYEWLDLGNQTVAALFEEGHRYQLKLQILPKENYLLQEGATVFVNGVACQTVDDANGQGVTLEYSFVKEIGRIEISVDPPTIETVPASPALLADAPAQITQHLWLDVATGEAVSVFVPGNHYHLDIALQPAQGYAFTGTTEFVVNGQAVNAVVTEAGATIRVKFTLPQLLDKVQIHGAPDSIQPGQQPQIPAIGCDLQHISVTDVQWMDEDKLVFDGTFEVGKIYFLAFSLHTDEMNAFADMVQVFCGETMLSEVECIDGKTCIVFIRYSLMPKVETAEVILPQPLVGEVPGVPTVGLDVPYSILTYSWTDLSSGEAVSVFEEGHSYKLHIELCPGDTAVFGALKVLFNGEGVELSALNDEFAALDVEFSFRHVIERIDVFAPELIAGKEVDPSKITVLTEGAMLQSGYWVNGISFEQLSGVVAKSVYTLRAAIVPLDGYEFASNAVIYLNGQPVEEYTVSQDSASCSVSYDLREAIRDIQISGMPQISIGGSTAPITMQVPEGAPYSVQANWLLYGGDYQFAGPGGAFEEGKLYYLEILIKPAEGYRIADDASVLVDGVAFSGITMTDVNGIWLYKQFNCGLQVIDRIELTVIAPVVGQLPGSVNLPAESHVTVREFTWAYSETADFADAVDLLQGDAFEAGFHYFISGSLVADSGYVFAENLIITVNGMPCNVDLGDLGVINLGDTAFLGHGFGLLEQQNQGSDPTGDTIGIAFAMMFASAAAWLALKRKK